MVGQLISVRIVKSSMKRIIGVTGGIASGKSNICNIIKNEGYVVIDSDKIVRDLSEVGLPIYNAIKERFGQDYLKEDLSLDKKKLAKLVFNNSAAKIVLDSITHPIVLEEIKRQINQIKDGIIFVDVPLLYEAKFETICDKVICAFVKKKVQVERLMERDKIDEDYALAKIHSQMDLYLKREKADYVVDTSGSFEQTKELVINLLNKIKGEQ